ncbi:TetR family transcriptional regulator [Kitasatospora sp. NBC_01287]|uniref:TetR family transcriptional regulator n=1 Tax=Kitasatospora sp. NBC_01287 TaxID=2903573 RepID=UPI002257084E|nr:TetR family transcriptional regulator [Kitasatospora sp. NBC_01287]MCX4747036.1 TetR family transcriptional regulator [Kitasatospora sp. NBC_01287]
MSEAQPTAATPDLQPGEAFAALYREPQSLRERKKQRTRRALRQEGYRLFAEQGWEATTVDQIAAAAEVSPATFFRYFPTKEDLVLSDEYDPSMAAALLARPLDEPFLVSARAVLVPMYRVVMEHDRDETLTRLRLMVEVPALRGRMLQGAEPQAMFLAVLTRRAGLQEPTLDMRVLVAAFTAALLEAMLYWAEQGGEQDLTVMLDRTIAALDKSFRI